MLLVVKHVQSCYSCVSLSELPAALLLLLLLL
jgi:hypothetical protein